MINYNSQCACARENCFEKCQKFKLKQADVFTCKTKEESRWYKRGRGGQLETDMRPRQRQLFLGKALVSRGKAQIVRSKTKWDGDNKSQTWKHFWGRHHVRLKSREVANNSYARISDAREHRWWISSTPYILFWHFISRFPVNFILAHWVSQ